mmetsp:Transcript_4381/g.10340  ORF Transcript_4381/g.10340 Transcript_4381/m.10340 type:complete len:272 (-) Transcript_4381:70-885(-)
MTVMAQRQWAPIAPHYLQENVHSRWTPAVVPQAPMPMSSLAGTDSRWAPALAVPQQQVPTQLQPQSQPQLSAAVPQLQLRAADLPPPREPDFQEVHELNLRLVQLAMGNKQEAVHALVDHLAIVCRRQGLQLSEVMAKGCEWHCSPCHLEVRTLLCFQETVAKRWDLANSSNCRSAVLDRFEEQIRAAQAAPTGGEWHTTLALVYLAALATTYNVELGGSKRRNRDSSPETNDLKSSGTARSSRSSSPTGSPKGRKALLPRPSSGNWRQRG